MTKETILKRAIEKAVENGWKGKIDWCGECLSKTDITHIIFDPEWAKAFFWKNNQIDTMDSWDYNQHHLLNLIQEGKDPIEYLEQFI